jgi:hypothetical protein
MEDRGCWLNQCSRGFTKTGFYRKYTMGLGEGSGAWQSSTESSAEDQIQEGSWAAAYQPPGEWKVACDS